MKKLLYFFLGVVFTLVLSVGGIYYFLNNRITLSSGDGEKTTVTAEQVKEAFSSKKIERINEKEYDEIVKGSSKKTLVTFWASWCGSCLKEIPDLKEYAKERNVDLVFINFDKQSDKQSKEVLGKMNKLGIEKTYQLVTTEGIVDPMNFKMLGSFLKDRSIEMDTLGLPITIVYNKGDFKYCFGPSQIKQLYFKELDALFEKQKDK